MSEAISGIRFSAQITVTASPSQERVEHCELMRLSRKQNPAAPPATK